jgi:hypothetical protein
VLQVFQVDLDVLAAPDAAYGGNKPDSGIWFNQENPSLALVVFADG